jgi:hypothetical protein
MKITISALTALLAVGTCMPLTADVTFTLDPVGGAVSGTPGGVVGWGFTFLNDTNFAVLSSSDFVSGTAVGTYVDYFQNYYDIVGPLPESDTLTETFDAGMMTGTGEFDIDPSAVVGAEWDGTIQLTYDLYNVDPNDPGFDPTADLVASGLTVSADASIDVVAPGSSVPEPALGAWAGLLCLGMCVRRSEGGLAPER